MDDVKAIKKIYCDIAGFIYKNRLWCIMALLMIAEMVVFSMLHSEPSSIYGDYVNNTEALYNTRLGFIFIENTKTILLTVAMGVIPFGIGSAFETYLVTDFLFSTGKWLLAAAGTKKFILGILPHGAFEITTIVLSMVISVLLSKTITAFIINFIRGRADINEFKADIAVVLKTVIFVLVPFIFVSAVAEIAGGYIIGMLLL